MEDVLLKVKNLTVHYVTRSETVKAVNNVSFELRKGETIGLVGETGAGKTTIARTIMHILPAPPAQIVSGTVELEGEDLYKKSETELEKIRGNKMAMVFQDPMTALNPVKRVGWQIAEGIRMHQKISKEDADKKALEIFEMVGIPAERFREYPHQFSGGMKQRVVIAIALACNPDLLICDEPTTALDVTIQAQVLDMITDLKKKRNMALIMITHDCRIRYCPPAVQESVAPLFAGAVWRNSNAGQGCAQAEPYQRCSARSDASARRLLLQDTMPICDRRLPQRRCGSSGFGRRPPVQVLPL